MGLRIRFENLTFTFLGLSVGESVAGGFSLSMNKTLFKRLVLNNGLPPQPELAILSLICVTQMLLFLIPSVQNVKHITDSPGKVCRPYLGREFDGTPTLRRDPFEGSTAVDLDARVKSEILRKLECLSMRMTKNVV
jgi:hypothetical protein